MLQELAQLDNKAEIILEDGRFASIHKVKVGHMIVAQDADPLVQMAKLITLVVKIDNQPVSVKDVLNLDIKDFSKIIEAVSK